MRDWKEWWIKAGKRALRTLVQVVVSAAAVAALAAIGDAKTLGEVDWLNVASTAALAAIVSLRMSLKGLPELNE